ncbi:S-layer homology domain-containing protein [Paenisporosarcina cavernae]|uniref:MBL fold metallo-hydrolase n=1 Tax=Paenisporosarcina cavernae TaxID=2320858 RepID=A0A385YPS0_9BACL|nr:S-layer homology domain-containing protein [Paenisporosarcina cavernae]AYC28739.1 MBL fold metallo-hydrolase [Paenisporosarcina cavernae]
MKKILLSLVTFVLFFSFTSFKNVDAASYSDVTPSHRFYEDIMLLLDRGIVSDSQRYGIDKPITREEVAIMVSKAVGLKGGNATTGFPDVPSNLSSSGYIKSAVDAGIIAGYTDGTFKPKEIVNRGQMAIFVARAFHLTNQKEVKFKDVSSNMFAYTAIRQILAANITTGFPDNTFKPNDKLTKGQISAFLARAIRNAQASIGNAKVHFIDVGQGDSILIQSASGKTMLIDGGPKSAGTKVVSYLKSKGVTKLDYVVATHPDADHIGGLISVLNSISIGTFLDSGKSHTTDTYLEMLQLIDSKNIKYEIPVEKEVINLDDNFKFTVLNAGKESDDNNEASIVLKGVFGTQSFLFMADADKNTELDIMSKYNVSANVLKAGHHGSDTSSGLSFLQAVKPQTTILSYGKDNSYGHPMASVLANLKLLNTRVYNTVDSCNVVVDTDGKTHSVSTSCTGSTSPQTPEPAPVNNNLSITSKDLSTEILAIKNTSTATINLSGWKLVSVQGNQIYEFPNVNLLAGKTIYVTSGPNAKSGNEYLKWTTANIWLNSGDPAKLINPQGAVISEFK